MTQGADASRTEPVGGSVQLIERDIEAPEVFETEERALWDGRPSLGGVWIAAPDVTDPERIIIRNPENGKFVIGALFKRERSNPGPKLQLSSDAAAALGIIAGAPTVVNVVALRREEVPDPQAAPEVTAPEASADALEGAPIEEEIIQVEGEAETGGDALAAASAAVAALDGLDADGADEAAELLPEADAAPMLEPADFPPRRGGVLSRLFGGGATDEAAPLAETTDLNAPPILDPVEEAATALTGAAPSVTATSLEEAAPAELQTAAATPQPAPAPAQPTGDLDLPYVQVGIFSVEQNARDTATALSGSGVLGSVREETSQGRTYWRVVVGPSMRASDRAAILRKARDLGFQDAFAVRG